jgi:hypothetical protein
MLSTPPAGNFWGGGCGVVQSLLAVFDVAIQAVVAAMTPPISHRMRSQCFKRHNPSQNTLDEGQFWPLVES